MSLDSKIGRNPKAFQTRRRGLSEKEFARVDPFVREALIENKQQGLLLAVRARWIALAVIAVLLPFLNFRLEMLYCEATLFIFAAIQPVD